MFKNSFIKINLFFVFLAGFANFSYANDAKTEANQKAVTWKTRLYNCRNYIYSVLGLSAIALLYFLNKKSGPVGDNPGNSSVPVPSGDNDVLDTVFSTNLFSSPGDENIKINYANSLSTSSQTSSSEVASISSESENIFAGAATNVSGDNIPKNLGDLLADSQPQTTQENPKVYDIDNDINFFADDSL